eukprot:Gregarina_sp_Pseudo_9__5796@NODE_872_length_2116_cov_15_857968_g820_i0_p1_GENE_NODE_872_length_2116_cov_15_857968_g820_i0NODE_872_length_2116_cov_15_857968_g820_i0_p1_ORF_typecomplete_len434_score79_95ANAPC4_WD40/PF12894_7/21ANAPC4_WD40/PF12894_7/6_6e05ANAPC4_WD40/PF12894_7/0_00042ANAPC4_WD40/PF12894_7/0_39ANAPC4_WD40/PF12894_7/6_4e08ANAPC4_WD40/PF12894_7/1_9e08ANAPC4_WD40/PF12894_7/3_5e07ANAPC4_WD40/PF12894_7/1_2e03WD40/PF00400_32/8_1WD40/PF00400_32/3_4e05WD40/PF00400_32/0_00033WD40/PF00400_32/
MEGENRLMDEPFPPSPSPPVPVMDGGNETGGLLPSDLKEVGRLPDWLWENPEVPNQDNLAVYSFAPLYAPDGRLFLAAGGGDETLRILELNATGEPAAGETGNAADAMMHVLSEFKMHADSITRCCLSSDNSMLAAASMDGKVSLYKLALENADRPLEVTHMTTLEGPAGEIEDCVWSPKGHLLLATSSDGMAWLWHAHRGYHGVLVGHGDVVTKGAFVNCLDSQNNPSIMVVTGSLDGTVIIWDPKSLTAKHKINIGDPGEEPRPIVAMSVHSSEPVIACGTADGYVHMVQANSGQRVRCVKLFEGEVTEVAFAPDVTRKEVGDLQLAVADTQGVIKIIDGSSFAVRHTLEHPDKVAVNHLCWGPSWPPTLISASEDGTIRIWDPRNGQLKDTLVGTAALISDLQVFPVANPPVLLVGASSEDGEIILWQLH